jgi:periplasmic copper chaperone A
MKRRNFMVLLFSPTVAVAHSAKIGSISIGHSWALPTKNSETSVMMPLLNSSFSDDALLSAFSPIASSVELRSAHGVQSDFRLAAGKPFPMRALANHLQLIGLTAPLIAGDKFALTLKFRIAGEMEIQIFVAEKAGE